MEEKEIRKKIKDGWILSSMAIEVLAATKEAAESALEKHVEKLEKEKKAEVTKKVWGENQEVENPLPKIEKAFSYIVNLEILTQTFEALLYLTMHYAPSNVEILEPTHMKINLAEAQGILNSVASLVHQYAAVGMGGVVIRT